MRPIAHHAIARLESLDAGPDLQHDTGIAIPQRHRFIQPREHRLQRRHQPIGANLVQHLPHLVRLRSGLGQKAAAGIYFAILVTTAIVVETVFAWPGLGRLAYEGISSRDFPVIQAVVLTTAAIVAVINLCVDCLYALIDPRIRYAR